MPIALVVFTNYNFTKNTCSNLDSKLLKLDSEYSKYLETDEGKSKSEIMSWGDKYWEIALDCSDKIESHLFSKKAMSIYSILKDPNLIETKLNEVSIDHPAMISILSYWENVISILRPDFNNRYLLKLDSISSNTKSDLVKSSVKINKASWYYENNYRDEAKSLISQVSKDSLKISPILSNKYSALSKKLKLIRVGEKLPDFEVKLLNGDVLSNQDFIGRYTFIYFYGSTCGSCISMYPILNKLDEVYDSKKFKVIGVGHDWQAEYGFSNIDEFSSFSNTYGITWEQISKNSLWKKFHINRLSTGLLIDPNGILVRVSNSKSVTNYENDFYSNTLEKIASEI